MPRSRKNNAAGPRLVATAAGGERSPVVGSASEGAAGDDDDADDSLVVAVHNSPVRRIGRCCSLQLSSVHGCGWPSKRFRLSSSSSRRGYREVARGMGVAGSCGCWVSQASSVLLVAAVQQRREQEWRHNLGPARAVIGQQKC